MIVGDLTLCDCGGESSVEALTQGTIFEAPGYVFVHGVLIDAHFFTRGLIGRHLYALADTKEPVGVGIDESTAVIVPGNGGLWRVIGQSSVALIRRGNAANVKHLEDFTLSLLNAGDSFDPVTGRIVVSPKRKPILLLRGGRCQADRNHAHLRPESGADDDRGPRPLDQRDGPRL